MHPQLAAIEADFRAAQRRLGRIGTEVSAEEWPHRSFPERWSVAECVAHLNLTAVGYRPILTAALSSARELGGGAPARLRRDPIGWLLWKSMPPPVRTKTKTVAAFMPGADQSAEHLMSDFLGLQKETIDFLRAADGLPIQRVRVVSPFNARIKYNLYACFTILAAHQHRHLWQAEQLFPGRFA